MANTLVPVGTITPFAGPVDEAWLESQGWLPCDGRSLVKGSYAELALAIGTDYGGGGGSQGVFNLPDLRGRFGRGVSGKSGHDPDADSRVASNTGGNIGDSIGSLQDCATALPKKDFTTSTDGDHTHNAAHAPVGNNAYALIGSHYALWTTDKKTTSKAGNHQHEVTTGWDQESRPRNRYVNYIIKYKSS